MGRTDKTERASIAALAQSILTKGDGAIYGTLGILLVLATIAMCGYSVVTFLQNIGSDFPLNLLEFIENLLFALIILEVLWTILTHLETGTTSLEPFLYIGIISATRRILAIGAQTTLGDVSHVPFNHQMIDLGVNGGVVLGLTGALFLFSRQRGGSHDRPVSPLGEGH